MTFTLKVVSKDSVEIDLGKVKNWDGEKNSNLEIIPMPANNVDFVSDDEQGTIGWDINGPTKQITVESDLTGDFDTLNATIKKMEDLIDGKQTQGTFHILRSNYVVNDSDSGTTAATKDLHVKVLNVKYNWVVPGLNKVHFTIEFQAAR